MRTHFSTRMIKMIKKGEEAGVTPTGSVEENVRMWLEGFCSHVS